MLPLVIGLKGPTWTQWGSITQMIIPLGLFSVEVRKHFPINAPDGKSPSTQFDLTPDFSFTLLSTLLLIVWLVRLISGMQVWKRQIFEAPVSLVKKIFDRATPSLAIFLIFLTITTFWYAYRWDSTGTYKPNCTNVFG